MYNIYRNCTRPKIMAPNHNSQHEKVYNIRDLIRTLRYCTTQSETAYLEHDS